MSASPPSKSYYIDHSQDAGSFVDATRSSAAARFASALWHKSDLLQEQCKRGLYQTKRFASFLKIFSESQKAEAKAILKASEELGERKHKLELDGMTRHMNAFLQLHTYVKKTTQAKVDMATKISNEIVEPLLKFYKEADADRKRLAQEEEKLREKLKELDVRLAKDKDECLKLYATYKETKKQGTGYKTKKAFLHYEELVKTFSKQKETLERELPLLVNQLERIETERLRNTNLYLRKFAELRETLDLNAKAELASLKKVELEDKDVDFDLEQYVKDNVNIYGAPPEKKSYHYDLPVKPEEIKNPDGTPIDTERRRSRAFSDSGSNLLLALTAYRTGSSGSMDSPTEPDDTSPAYSSSPTTPTLDMSPVRRTTPTVPPPIPPASGATAKTETTSTGPLPPPRKKSFIATATASTLITGGSGERDSDGRPAPLWGTTRASITSSMTSSPLRPFPPKTPRSQSPPSPSVSRSYPYPGTLSVGVSSSTSSSSSSGSSPSSPPRPTTPLASLAKYNPFKTPKKPEK